MQKIGRISNALSKWRVGVRDWGPRTWTRLRQACCRHAHVYRVTEGDVRYFRCDCGYQVPQLRRSPEERAQLRARWPR
jgi:hypothetical protein